MNLKKHLIRKNQIATSMAVSVMLVVAGVTLYVSDRQSPHFKNDMDYVMVGEHKNYNAYKPNSRSAQYSSNLSTEVEMIDREQFSPSNFTPNSNTPNSSQTTSGIAYHHNSINQSTSRATAAGGGSGSGMIAMGSRKNGFSTSTPNMSGVSMKGSSQMSDPFENTPIQKSGDWDDLTPPGDEGPVGPPLPVGNGVYILLLMGSLYVARLGFKFRRLS